MSAGERSSKLRRPRRWVQISLGTMLLLLAIVPPAVWWWWTRPIRVETVKQETTPANPFANSNPFGGGGAAPTTTTTREVHTERREGLGEPVRDGLTEVFDDAGAKIREETWRQGELHGALRRWDASGQLIEEGEYSGGKKHGQWRQWDAQGRLTQDMHYEQDRPDRGVVYLYTTPGQRPHTMWETTTDEATGLSRRSQWLGDRETLVSQFMRDERGFQGQFKSWYSSGSPQWSGTYADGKRHGDWTWTSDDGQEERLFQYDKGQLQSINGKDLDEFANRLLARREVPPLIVTKLRDDTHIEFVETPLSDVALILEDRHQVQISIDERALAEIGLGADMPITAIQRSVPLILALDLTLSPLELTLDYRYEHLWITSKESVESWQDRTGVSEAGLTPDAPLAQALDSPSQLEFVQLPLRLVVEFLASRHKIPIQLDPAGVESGDIDDQAPVTLQLRGVSLRAVLGTVLESQGLRCIERDGELVILPAQKPPR